MNKPFYKHPQYKHVYGHELVSPIGRIVFPALVKPKDPPPPQPGQAPGQPRYEATLVIPKKDPKVHAFLKELTQMSDQMLELFNDKRSATISLPGNRLKDGDDVQLYDHEKYPFFAKCWALVARNVKMFPLFDAKKEDVSPEMIKGGMLGRFLVTPMITAHGLSFKITGLQLAKDDGVRYGGSIASPSSFLDVLDDSEEESEEEVEEQTEEEDSEEAPPPPVAKKASKGKATILGKL